MTKCELCNNSGQVVHAGDGKLIPCPRCKGAEHPPGPGELRAAKAIIGLGCIGLLNKDAPILASIIARETGCKRMYHVLKNVVWTTSSDCVWCSEEAPRHAVDCQLAAALAAYEKGQT